MRATNEQYAMIGRRMNILYHLHIAVREAKKVSKLWDDMIKGIGGTG